MPFIENLNPLLLSLIAALLGVIIWGGQSFISWQKSQSTQFIQRFTKNDEEHTKIFLKIQELSILQSQHDVKINQHDKEILSIIDHIKKTL